MGKPIIPKEIRNANWPEWDFLSPEQQEAYSEAIKRFSGNAFNYLNRECNLWKVHFIEQEGIARILPLHQLIDVANAYPKDFKGHYSDVCAVALRNTGSPYSDQLYKLLKNPNLEHTLIIEGLEIEQDENYPDGLKFKDTSKIRVFPAPDFDHQNNGRRFRSINYNYSIKWVKDGEDLEGSKILYTRSNDASRLYVNRGLDVYSNDLDFRVSGPDGRVVVKSAEGAAQNFDRYVIELDAERKKQLAELEKQKVEIQTRFPNAVRYLQTGKL